MKIKGKFSLLPSYKGVLYHPSTTIVFIVFIEKGILTVNYRMETSITFLPTVKSVSMDLANTERPASFLPIL